MGFLDLLIQANTRMHFTTKYNCWVEGKSFFNQKQIGKMGKNILGTKKNFSEHYLELHGKKLPPQTPKT